MATTTAPERAVFRAAGERVDVDTIDELAGAAARLLARLFVNIDLEVLVKGPATWSAVRCSACHRVRPAGACS